MQPDLALPGPSAAVPAAWQRPLIVLATLAGLLLLAFARDWATMADQWWNSSTYNHVLLVPPVIAWLAWQRWPALQQLVPHGWWPGAVLFAAAVLLWVLGAFAGFSLLRQAGAVAMLGSLVLACLGPRVGAGLAFPLAYMVFLVPFGDELVPLLQTVTAKLTVALVHVSGISAVIDGVFIDTPAGLFEVAEACSGIKFLIAMIALGALVSNLCFRSWSRRIAFMAVCVVVPVLANAVRAWATIFAAQYVGAARAGGFDHIVYGWFFFAVVIAMVLGIGWRFFDHPADAPLIDLARLQSGRLLVRLARQQASTSVLATVLTASVLAGQAWAWSADRLEATVPPLIRLPAVPGWHRVDYRPALWWEPRADGANHRLLGRYANAQGQAVDVFLAIYSSQSEGREAGGFGQGALVPDSGWAWRAPGPGLGGGHGEYLLGRGQVDRLAVTWYRTGDLLTGSNIQLKLANIGDRLLLRARPTAMLILSAEAAHGRPAAQTIEAFRRSAGALGPWVDRIGTGG